MREPDCERAWFAPGCCMLEMELDRFMADEGIGIDVLLAMGASVCASGQSERALFVTEGASTYLAADREEARFLGHGRCSVSRYGVVAKLGAEEYASSEARDTVVLRMGGGVFVVMGRISPSAIATRRLSDWPRTRLCFVV
jgi:hypothetical protein